MSTEERTYGGRYSVIERVGSGGMAEVYRARDELLGREVALKVLHARFSQDRAFVERFKREAQAAANLNHPNIVSLFDYGADDGAYFIVMELIEGKPLSELLRDEGALMPERAAEIGADVAKALSRAHTGGLVHRDIKPSNIMITTSGQTKVTDFGIARALGSEGDQSMTQTGMVIGTAAYFSPEQAQGNPVDARSDVYALGVVLYEMLAGRPPFTGETPLAVAYKHVREDPPAPSTVNSDVPKGLDAITMKALAKNPDNRFSSATEMQEDLERFLAGQKVHATPLLGATQAVTSTQPAGSDTAVLQQTSEYVPPPEPRSRAGWYVLAALAILALFGVLAYLFATNFFGGARQVNVPNVIDLQVDEATTILEGREFDVEVDRRPSNKKEGRVLSQDPPAGREADEGSTVTLVVSGGPRQTTVPEIIDVAQDEAEALLEDAGLEVGEVTPGASDEIDPGNVITSDPEPGTEVDRGSTVDLVVSSGPSTIPVPDVRGRTEEEAIDILDGDFTVEVVYGPSDTVQQDRVISQDPAQDSEAEPGDTVTITVSTGPEERPMPSVIGEDADTAEAFLEDEYGLVVTQETITDPGCPEPPGDVCGQDPAEGEPVSSGDSVTLFVQGP